MPEGWSRAEVGDHQPESVRGAHYRARAHSNKKTASASRDDVRGRFAKHNAIILKRSAGLAAASVTFARDDHDARQGR